MSGFTFIRNAIIAAAAMALPSLAHADPIPGLYNTGLDAAGTRIAGNGGADAHYRVNGHAAITYYNPAYYGTSDSQWIGEMDGGTYSPPPGSVESPAIVNYTLTFDLTGLNPATARISGTWGVDNYGIVLINGVRVSDNPAGFSSPTTFNITSGFHAGPNTITFQVIDYGPPAAFVVSGISGTANRASPPTWTTGDYGAWSTTCGSATRSRPVTCYNPDDGTTLDASSCDPSTRPAATDSSYQTAGCGYAWEPGPFGAVTPSCGATVQTRTIQCRRSDDQYVDASSCDPATRPSTSQTVNDYSACGYDWATGDWSAPSTTCGDATQSRTVTCRRSDGALTSDSSCTGARPEATQTTHQTSGCGYEWIEGSWSAPAPACGDTTQSRTVTCRRADGETVDDASCTSPRPSSTQPARSYETCGYGWAVGEWGAPSSTCGAATETRTVTCRRSDDTDVDDARCAADGTRPETGRDSYQTGGCGYAWEPGAYGPAAPACGASTATRPVLCRRSDGQTAADALCTSARPSDTMPTTDYSTCTFHWTVGEWATPSACGTVTRTRSVACSRSDETPTDAAKCDAGSRPPESELVEDTSSCTYSWQQTSTGPWSACVGGTQTRSVTVQCQRADGTKAADAQCLTPRPAVTESQSCATTTPTTPTEPRTGDVIIFRRALGITVGK